MATWPDGAGAGHGRYRPGPDGLHRIPKAAPRHPMRTINHASGHYPTPTRGWTSWSGLTSRALPPSSVEGNITSIGNMTSSDIMVHPSYAGVSGAGKVPAPAGPRDQHHRFPRQHPSAPSKNRDTIDVVFDEVSEKKPSRSRWMPPAVSIADGYMLNKTAAVPAEIPCAAPPVSWIRCPALWPRCERRRAGRPPPPCPPRWSCVMPRTANTSSPRSTPRWRATSANVTPTIYRVRELPLEGGFHRRAQTALDVESLQPEPTRR